MYVIMDWWPAILDLEHDARGSDTESSDSILNYAPVVWRAACSPSKSAWAHSLAMHLKSPTHPHQTSGVAKG